MAALTAEARTARAHELGLNDLVLSYLSLPKAGFEERVSAAAAAGFAGIGIHIAGWKRLRREGWGVADLAAVLDRYGVLAVEIEFLQGWAGRPEVAAVAAEQEELAFELIDGLGARHLQIGGPYATSWDEAVEAFAGLCDRAAPRGVFVSLEYLPEMTNIGSVGEALAIVDAADRPNGGVCTDSWHHERGPDSLADLAAAAEAVTETAAAAAVGRPRITSVQFDDGPVPRAEADYVTDTSTNRLPPGEGAFDLVGFLRTLGRAGVRAPLGLEVISPSVAAAEPAAVAARLAAGARSVLAQAFGD